MRLLLIIIALILPCSAIARDAYYNANPKWKTEFNIDTHVRVKSTNKLNQHQTKLVKKTYEIAERKFLKFWNLRHNECRFQPLEIKIVKHHNELDNRIYFPMERTYADKPGEGTEIIYGRYFAFHNALYIVPPYTSKYYWKKNFVHELTHYFFDECGIRFNNIEEEHIAVERFVREYKRFFY